MIVAGQGEDERFIRDALTAARESGTLTVAMTEARHALSCDGTDYLFAPAMNDSLWPGQADQTLATAIKVFANVLSTEYAGMLAHNVMDGRMVNFATRANGKLSNRSIEVVMNIAHCPRDRAEAALEAMNHSPKHAFVYLGLDGQSPDFAAVDRWLKNHGGDARAALSSAMRAAAPSPGMPRPAKA